MKRNEQCRSIALLGCIVIAMVACGKDSGNSAKAPERIANPLLGEWEVDRDIDPEQLEIVDLLIQLKPEMGNSWKFGWDSMELAGQAIPVRYEENADGSWSVIPDVSARAEAKFRWDVLDDDHIRMHNSADPESRDAMVYRRSMEAPPAPANGPFEGTWVWDEEASRDTAEQKDIDGMRSMIEKSGDQVAQLIFSGQTLRFMGQKMVVEYASQNGSTQVTVVAPAVPFSFDISNTSDDLIGFAIKAQRTSGALQYRRQ